MASDGIEYLTFHRVYHISPYRVDKGVINVIDWMLQNIPALP